MLKFAITQFQIGHWNSVFISSIVKASSRIQAHCKVLVYTLQFHLVQSEPDATNASFTSRLRAELSAGGEPIGAFYNKVLQKQEIKCFFFLRSLFSGLISKPLIFISYHNWGYSFHATVIYMSLQFEAYRIHNIQSIIFVQLFKQTLSSNFLVSYIID